MVVLIPESLKSFVSKPGVVHVILTAEPESSDTHVRTHTDTHNLFYVTVEDPRDSVPLPPPHLPPHSYPTLLLLLVWARVEKKISTQSHTVEKKNTFRYSQDLLLGICINIFHQNVR